MPDTAADSLDGTRMEYTYAELGTVRVAYDGGRMGFEWTAGALQGEAGEGFPYRSRRVGDGQYFVSWHEPAARGFVTLLIDFSAGRVHGSVLAAYGTDREQVHFDEATIDHVDR